MPRPREFDEQEVVAKATAVFRRRGYHATSVRDLGEELALKPSSLYRTFTDKHTLFLRALDHYRAHDSAEAERRLEQADSCREALRDWMIWMISGAPEAEDADGCFVVNTATELGTTDAAVRQRIEAAFEVTREALHNVLRRGLAAAELPADLDIDAAVEFLFTTVLGLRVRERAGHSPARLITAIDFAISSLGPAPENA
ncbi:TetR/AcrR family transcriptional regulator [Nocardia goodfellowii]|uniref:TetR/AcrR family transcriptional repressor of nem operon n=1 Tax=Nocardia goodfellowii TaxID=882446 RepID=A0ABS4QI90_9NOCA|nr:TetR/AcrR family transcriptional regulator [Nocardia goodfellowii]MBP2191412.1 TetR/AcrR family transcriptional repressor of nem operon [Nocardia goodfellowii]